MIASGTIKMNQKDQALREFVAALKEAEACLGLEVILQGREPDLKKWQAAIALGDSALSMPVQSHEAWVEQTMGIVTHISELHSRCLRHDTKALHDAWTAKKAELRAHLNNHPAATPELSQADIETIWRAHAPCNIVDYGASANGVNTWLFEMVKAMIATTKRAERLT